MPIPKTIRVNPLDLQKVIIGVALPFDAAGVFRSTYSTKDQIRSNLINLLLTKPGERIMNPEYGAYLWDALFNNLVDDNYNIIRERINSAVNRFMPEITLQDVEVIPDTDRSILSITISYIINISEDADEITVQLT